MSGRTLKRSFSQSANYAPASSFKRSKVSALVRTRTSPAIRKYVAKAIQRYAEVKSAMRFTGRTILQAAVPGAATVPTQFNAIPSILVGTGAGARIGNRISTSSLEVKVDYFYQPYNAISNPTLAPVTVLCWLAEYIPTAQPAALTTLEFATFFQNGSATLNFQGNSLDGQFAVNKDVWRIHGHKRMQLGMTAIPPGITSVLSVTGNNKNHGQMKFNLKNYKHLIYDDSATNLPTNRNLYVVLTYFKGDGVTNGIVQNLVDFSFTCCIKYTDL